ncbi:inositol monophosphatase family protein [Aquihabitans sp. G128]|uniref:inositol monophosphatase family protein n=1 Tax=Aquihabitans sp. G128 TaxID=2849779 RepID=UPI0020B1E230|nr:inositol monophosphatase family protein [Aquihabitans sp. G128]
MTDPTPTDLPTDPRQLLALARPLAEEVAARLVASLDGAGPAVTSKSTATDLVTELDTWAEAFLTERLLAARPHDAVQGEEGADVTGTSGVTWSIDPIDGTVNFVHGLPGFCVSIAAKVDGRPVAGVVASPLHRDVFTATLGGGAFRNDRAIHVAEPASVARSVVGTGFGYDPDRRRRQAEVLTRVLPRIADIRRGGAAAVDLCSVACGRLDAYWEVGLNDWDHAAGALVAAEAGARVGGLAGEAPSERFIVAAPQVIWDDLVALLAEAGADAV